MAYTKQQRQAKEAEKEAKLKAEMEARIKAELEYFGEFSPSA